MLALLRQFATSPEAQRQWSMVKQQNKVLLDIASYFKCFFFRPGLQSLWSKNAE